MFHCLKEKRKIFVAIISILAIVSVYNWNTNSVAKLARSGAYLESNLEYIDMVKVHEETCAFIETHYPDSTVGACWPPIYQLRFPLLGYVTKPVKTVEYSKDICDIVMIAEQSTEFEEMKQWVNEKMYELVHSFSVKDKKAYIYTTGT
jgi:hypothetical protein